MKPFLAGLFAIGAMVLSLEFVAAATREYRPEAHLTPTGNLSDLTSINYPAAWIPE